jgi:hypothetical protein
MTLQIKRAFLVDSDGNVFAEMRLVCEPSETKAIVLSALGGMLQSKPMMVPAEDRAWFITYMKPSPPFPSCFLDPLFEPRPITATATFVQTERTVTVDGVNAIVFDLQF